MRITEKGQVTIPKPIRERHGFYPGNEVQIVERNDRVVLEKVQGRDIWREYRGALKIGKRTDEIIRALRGPHP